MKNKRNKRIIFLLVSAFMTMFLVGVAYAADVQIKNPVFIYPETISICIMPFQTTGIKILSLTELRKKITSTFIEKGDFNFMFYIPNDKDSEQIYKYGFLENKEKNRITIKYPYYEYWKDKDIQYILFGSYKVEKKKLLLEVYLYSTVDNNTLMNKRYTVDMDSIQMIQERIVAIILDVFKKYHTDSHPPQIK